MHLPTNPLIAPLRELLGAEDNWVRRNDGSSRRRYVEALSNAYAALHVAEAQSSLHANVFEVLSHASPDALKRIVQRAEVHGTESHPQGDKDSLPITEQDVLSLLRDLSTILKIPTPRYEDLKSTKVMDGIAEYESWRESMRKK